MERVFYLRKRYRNVAIGSLLFFLCMGIGSPIGMMLDAPENRQVSFAIFTAVFWGFWVCLELWSLLEYRCKSVSIRNGHVLLKEVNGSTEIHLSDVTQAQWRWGEQGRIILRTATKKALIEFNKFESNEALWLVRYFRDGLSESVQHGWDIFCYKTAVRLRKDVEETDSPPEPDEVVIHRNRWNWYFIPASVLLSVWGVVHYWTTAETRVFGMPILIAGLWIYLWINTPQTGMVAKRIRAVPGQTGYIFWCLLPLIGLALYGIFKQYLLVPLLVGIVAGVVWVGGMVFFIFRMIRKERQRDLETARLAVLQWATGENRRDDIEKNW